MCAVNQLSVLCVLELLKHGARRDLRNNKGHSADDIVKQEPEDDDPAVKVKQRAVPQIFADLDAGKSIAEVEETCTCTRNRTSPARTRN